MTPLTAEQIDVINELINEEVATLEFVLENEILTDEEREEIVEKLNLLRSIPNMEDVQ